MPDRDLKAMAGLMGEAAEALAAQQALGLAVLKAELDALAHLLPGAVAAETEAEAEARRATETAEIEAGFDNMPV